MNKQEKGDNAYFGSVRFFKHLIITMVALAVLIPVCIAVVLAGRTVKLKQETQIGQEQNKRLEEEQKQLKEELSSLSAELDRMQNAAVAETETEDITAEHIVENTEDWELLLVNELHPLDSHFHVELAGIGRGQEVDIRIQKDLERMLQDMEEEGMHPIVCSSYRDLEKQTALFEEYISEKVADGWTYKDAFYKAKTRVALPGTSEHHTGLAVDIVGVDYQSLDAGQADTKEAKWLAENCADYGFILRYPKGKQAKTGIEYESWHFRYVGVEAATYIMKNGIVLEEFLESAGVSDAN